jgi:hypothetical protein
VPMTDETAHIQEKLDTGGVRADAEHIDVEAPLPRAEKRSPNEGDDTEPPTGRTVARDAESPPLSSLLAVRAVLLKSTGCCTRPAHTRQVAEA